MAVEEALKSAMAECGYGGRVSSRGVDGVDERGVIGKDGRGALEQLSDAADSRPLRDARGLDRRVPQGSGCEGSDAPVGDEGACPPSP